MVLHDASSLSREAGGARFYDQAATAPAGKKTDVFQGDRSRGLNFSHVGKWAKPDVRRGNTCFNNDVFHMGLKPPRRFSDKRDSTR